MNDPVRKGFEGVGQVLGSIYVLLLSLFLLLLSAVFSPVGIIIILVSLVLWRVR
jgi:hypothetical protein